ncbi:endonuclease Q family protein [Candidatus Uhrbacteria bacterium]|nr:endonuclease Q family protein [Candidatus Uhrbacteria bacterium]
MRVITDFHLHSKWSRACSKDLTIPNIAKACERKGIDFVGTSDFTHPAWRGEIGRELVDEGGGTFRLRDESSKTRFLLATELSCIYKRGGKVRRVHLCVLCSSLDGVDRFTKALVDRGCNIKADGRPILGIDSEELLKMLLEADPEALMIPAHAWTPWFAVFGSMSGFDSLDECFGEMTPHIHAIETGLSSDPKMNWRLPSLDNVFLVSNSDAHSLDKLGREANVFDMVAPSYAELRRILVEKDLSKFIETIEFFPEEGKYHTDGHRLCEFSCAPQETKRLKGLCPKCGKPLTIGVLHRIDDLAGRSEGERGKLAVPYRSIVPLAELIGSVFDVGASSKKVAREVEKLVKDGRTEFGVLLDESVSTLGTVTSSEIVEAIVQMREGKMDIRPGFDGEYGVIRVAAGMMPKPEQKNLL